jgi:mono/diheme cytochrome c family protein
MISLHSVRTLKCAAAVTILRVNKYRWEKLEMKVSIKMVFLALLLALFLGGCGKQSAAEREAHDRAKPGYQVAKSFCSQCHTLPFADQHPPAAWPYVVSRMEGYMESAHRRMPNPAEREAIIAYFQSN